METIESLAIKIAELEAKIDSVEFTVNQAIGAIVHAIETLEILYSNENVHVNQH
jgi:hypothetical protein